MHEFVVLSVTSFRGAIGAEHYYGRLQVRTKMTRITRPDGSTGYVTRLGGDTEKHPHDGHDVTRRLGAREAAHLNEKDGYFLPGSSGLKAGSRTTRFNDVESIAKAAVLVFRDMFDETDVLVLEDRHNPENFRVLAGPDGFAEALAAIASFTRREDWLMERGYLVMPDAAGHARTKQ